MKYIKVTNIADEVSRLKLEKLGFSTKRDDDSTIGQFGSGIKFAPISAIRKGIEFIFTGNDSKGSYVLNYIVKDDEGVPSIFYDYGDYVKPSSFTVDAGTLSWNDEFQIFREVVANAIDEAKISKTLWDLRIVDVDKIEPVDGEFSVYLSATDKMVELLQDFDKYFSVNRTPVFSTGGFKLYMPIDDSFRVYNKGVLVYSSAHRSERYNTERLFGIFDYEFEYLGLNEERTVKSEYDMNNKIVLAYRDLTDEQLISRIISCMVESALDPDCDSGYYETMAIPSYIMTTGGFQSNEIWVNEFEKLYPKTVLVNADNITINQKLTVKARGLDSIAIHNELIYSFLTNRGIKSLASILGSEFIYDYTMDWELTANLINAVEIVNFVYEDYGDVLHHLGVFDDSDDDDNGLLGMTVKVKLDPEDPECEAVRVMLIAKSHAEYGTVQEIIGTLIHEWDHYRTMIGDGDIEGRMFRSLADKRIGELVYNYWVLHNMEENRLN